MYTVHIYFKDGTSKRRDLIGYPDVYEFVCGLRRGNIIGIEIEEVVTKTTPIQTMEDLEAWYKHKVLYAQRMHS